ncbi:hypothetical protein J4E80_002993 [Alternaria sp. BMP 0032]|nr:hypothetical protein J4E80_002993 [Alternaria sp. BMP 0032]
MGKQRGIHYEELPETPEPARSLRDLLPPNLVKLRLKYDRSAMNANVDYTAELRGLVQDDSNCPRKLQKEYFKANGIEFHYIVKYTTEMDNEYNWHYTIGILAAMGYEGAYMCKWSVTNGEFWMTPEELYDIVEYV